MGFEDLGGINQILKGKIEKGGGWCYSRDATWMWFAE